MTTIKIKDLIGTEVRSRLNADKITQNISGKTILDFSGVDFISRSFADELYNITQDYKEISITGMTDFVHAMFDTVSESRKHKRVYKEDDVEIITINNMEELSAYMAF